ncbi:MAG TPA: AraC family ligand binding domain-containing protein, partial [Bacilli bacterium]
MNFLERASYDWTEDSVRLINSPGLTAKSSYFYVQETGYFQTKPRYFTEREHLNSYLIVYTLSGKGILRYRGKSHRLQAGQAFFIDCMEYQYYETDRNEPWEILWVHFNGATSRGYYEEFVKQDSPVISMDQEIAVPSIMRKILDNQRNKDRRTELVTSQLIVQLLTELLLSTNDQLSSDDFMPDYLKGAVAEIEKYFNEKITLDQLAAKYAINKFYLAKEFKKYTGVTPNEFLIQTRINYAKEHLQYSGLSV